MGETHPNLSEAAPARADEVFGDGHFIEVVLVLPNLGFSDQGHPLLGRGQGPI